MKKIIFACLLLLTVNEGNIFAQINRLPFYEKPKTDQYFSVINENLLRHKFYLQLGSGNQMQIELNNKKQLDSLANIDSILSVLYLDLLQIKDSLKSELTNKRVDFMLGFDKKVKMRYQEYQPKGNSYTFLDNEAVALKIEQDSIIILGYTKSDKIIKIERKDVNYIDPFRITILLNNLAEFRQYLNSNFNSSIAKLHKDWDNYKEWTEKNNWDKRLTASYNLIDSSKNRAIRDLDIIHKGKYFFEPYIQVSVQNARNLFAPAAAVGLDFYRTRSTNKGQYFNNEKEEHFQLFVEGYFFFEKNGDKNTEMKLSKFITFQYRSIWNENDPNEKKAIKYYQQFSLGWQFSNSKNAAGYGAFLPNNSFKLGFPGFQYRNVMLTPEFFFHDFFKQFSPSLKLCLQFD